MPHVVLLGDSVFDNAAYVGRGPDVVEQLRADLPPGWGATLAARDGATMAGVPAQLASIPADATHLVLSVGGNDALRLSGIIERPVRSVAEALGGLGEVARGFERDYGALLDTILERRLPTAVCTIYNPQYAEERRRLVVTALAVLNDPIVRCAATRGLPIVDLRLVSSDPADFANPIEPSVRGGEKIAAVIASLVQHHPFGAGRSAIYR